MPTLQLTFTEPINTSVQIGDMVYYVPTNPTGTFDTAPLNNATEIGEVTLVQDPTPHIMPNANAIVSSVYAAGTSLSMATSLSPSQPVLPGMIIQGNGWPPNTIVVTAIGLTIVLSNAHPLGNAAPSGPNNLYSFLVPAKINVFDPTAPINVPNAGDFIMFAKNRAVNTSGIIGYYADIKLSNNSRDKAEMFSIASSVIESSK